MIIINGKNISNNMSGDDGNVFGDNHKEIELKNENISISGNNFANVLTKNGNISINGNNEGDSETKNGNVFIGGYNKKNAITKNGGITCNGINYGLLNTKNGDVITQSNMGKLVTTNGLIRMGNDLLIKVDKLMISSYGGNGISVSGGSGNISIINNVVYVNGQIQNGSTNNKYMVDINNGYISIDFIKKEVFIGGKKVDSNNKDIIIEKDKIIMEIDNQELTVTQDEISLQKI